MYDDGYERHMRYIDSLEAGLNVPVYFCVGSWGLTNYPSTLIYFDDVTAEAYPL